MKVPHLDSWLGLRFSHPRSQQHDPPLACAFSTASLIGTFFVSHFMLLVIIDFHLPQEKVSRSWALRPGQDTLLNSKDAEGCCEENGIH